MKKRRFIRQLKGKKKKPRKKIPFKKIFTHRQSKGGMKNGDWIDGNLLRSHGGWVFPLILMLV